MARISTVILAVLATVMALLVPNVLDLLLYSYSFWAPAVILPVVVGLLWYRKEMIYPVIASMLVGLGIAILWLSLGEPLELQGSVAGVFAAVITFFVSRPALRGVPLKKMFVPQELEAESAREG